MKKKQSIKSRYHEHAGEERKLHGYHKPKSKKKSYKHFKAKAEAKEERLEEKIHPGIHKRVAALKKKTKSKNKIHKVLKEFKEGKLHAGSKKGPAVKSRKQAIAIALSEARKAGQKVKPKK